jgi:hypothetical protein
VAQLQRVQRQRRASRLADLYRARLPVTVRFVLPTSLVLRCIQVRYENSVRSTRAQRPRIERDRAGNDKAADRGSTSGGRLGG